MALTHRTGFVVSQDHPLPDAVEFAAEHGFEFVEVKMQGVTDRAALESAPAAFGERLDEYDVDLLVHLPYQLDIGSPHPYVREGSVDELEACLECAGALGAEKATVHAESRAWIGGDRRENVLESIDRLDGTAAEFGVELCAENPLRGTVPIHDFDAVFDATDVSMTLDTGHARCDGLSSEEIAAFVAGNAGRISHVHLNDTLGESDDHLPFGAGTVDFPRVLEALPDDWNGTLSLEIASADREYLTVSKRRLDRTLGRTN